MNEATQISGVSLAPPQSMYVAYTKDTQIQLTRDDWSIPSGTIQLSPSPEWRAEHKSHELISTYSSRRFLSLWRPNHSEEEAILKQLFPLLVKHHLLSHAELLLARPPAIVDNMNEALSLLQSQIHKLFDPKSYSGSYCEQCEKSKWGSLSAQERHRIYWYNRTNIEICPHNALLAPAMESLFTTFPELMFEILGLITPERSQKVKQKPIRYTLTPYAFLASLGQKLLGASSLYRVGEEWHAEELPEEKLSKPARLPKQDPETKAYKETILFSARAWGYTGRPEAFENQQPSRLYPTLGGAELPPKEEIPTEAPKPAKKREKKETQKEKAARSKVDEIINFLEELTEAPEPKQATQEPAQETKREAPETTQPETSTLNMDAQLFLQQIGDANKTLQEMLSQLKSLAPSIQESIMALPMKTVIDLLFDLSDED